jgi:nucleoside 2-deoxyribosyltransferase
MAKKCFVIMPFEEKFNGIWKHVIKPTVEDTGDECLRADDIFAPGSIIEDVIHAIHEANYIIADVSEQNPNVYYELGFAHAIEKPVILLTSDISKLPFDIKQQRVIKYSDTAAGAADLKQSLKKYLTTI